MTSYTNTEKRIWEDTPAGQLEVQIKKLHNKLYDQEKLTDEIVRWVDIHRASTMSAERDMVEEFTKEQAELETRYRDKHNDYMMQQYQKEIDHLSTFL